MPSWAAASGGMCDRAMLRQRLLLHLLAENALKNRAQIAKRARAIAGGNYMSANEFRDHSSHGPSPTERSDRPTGPRIRVAAARARAMTPYAAGAAEAARPPGNTSEMQ
jgi:hypothetical protein